MTGLRSILTTPRAVPSRRWPALAGTGVIVLALPVFAAAGWSLGAWVLAAVLWAAGEALAFAIARLPIGLDNLASSGLVGLVTMFRVIAVMVVLLVVAASNDSLALPAALLYVAAYSLELAVSLVSYFGSAR